MSLVTYELESFCPVQQSGLGTGNPNKEGPVGSPSLGRGNQS